MTTVLTLAGYGDLFQTHIPILPPGTVRQVLYNNFDPIWGAWDASNKLDAALHALSRNEDIIVVGVSFGAVGATRWQIDRGATSDIGPDRLRFLYQGNSVRRGNGLGLLIHSGEPLPNDNPRHHVIDIACQGDQWADYPNVTSSPYYWQAVNAVTWWDRSPGIHIWGYEGKTLNDPSYRRTLVGNIEYVLIPRNDPVPDYWFTPVTRAQIETAYNRLVK